MRGVDGNFDGNGTTTDLLTFQGSDGLLLLGLAADINKSVALAFPGLSPAPADNAGADDVNSGLSEEGRKSGIINAESKVGNKKHGGGGFTSGVFASGTRGTGSFGLARTGLLGRALGGRGLTVCYWCGCLISSGSVLASGVALSSSLLGLALKDGR